MKRKPNVRLLRKIQRVITEEPKRFFMSGYMVKYQNPERWERDVFYADDLSKTPPPCGTAACIAGWANLLTNKSPKLNALGVAAKTLGITNSESLFNSSFWPEPFCDQFEKAKTPRARARIACARIDYLIKTGK